MTQPRGTRGHGSHRGTQQRGSRRKTSWFLNGSVADNNVAPGLLTSFELATGLSAEGRPGSTVTRIRGEMVVWATAATFPALNQAIWFAGIIVGHENLLTTVPDPELDDADWMWYQTGYFVPDLVEDDAGVQTLLQFPARYVTLDNRSQRKMLSEDSVVLFVIKNDASSDFAFNVGLTARVLVKLR